MIRIIISLTIAMMIGLYPVASMAQDTSGPTISKIIATHEDAVEVLYKKMRGKPREEQQKLYLAEYPKPDQAIESITALVIANPGGSGSLDGIDWLLRYSGSKRARSRPLQCTRNTSPPQRKAPSYCPENGSESNSRNAKLSH
jgi:hypothetical protein